MIIKDPLMEPYFIDANDVSHDVKKTAVNQDSGSKNFGQEYEQTIGYYTNLDNALKKIITLKANEGNEVVNLKEYLAQYKKIVEELKNITV